MLRLCKSVALVGLTAVVLSCELGDAQIALRITDATALVNGAIEAGGEVTLRLSTSTGDTFAERRLSSATALPSRITLRSDDRGASVVIWAEASADSVALARGAVRVRFGRGNDPIPAELVLLHACEARTEAQGQACRHAEESIDVATCVRGACLPVTEESPYVASVIVGGGAGEGDPRRVPLLYPAGMASDGLGGWFIADAVGQRVYHVDAELRMTPFAGDGQQGLGAEMGPAALTRIDTPICVAVDLFGNVLFTEISNNAIRHVDRSTGIMRRVATDPSLRPTCIAASPDGRMLVSDSRGFLLRMRLGGDADLEELEVLAGSGLPFTPTAEPDVSSAGDARLGYPTGIAMDHEGHIYMADEERHVVVVVDTASQTLERLAGQWDIAGYVGDGAAAGEALLSRPFGLALAPDGILYVAEQGSEVVRRITLLPGSWRDSEVTTFAGDGIAGGVDDVPARFHGPMGLVSLEDDALLVSENRNRVVRRLDSAGGATWIAGAAVTLADDVRRPAASTALLSTSELAVGWYEGAERLYAADARLHIMEIDLASATARVLAGSGVLGDGGAGGPALSVPMNLLTGVAVHPLTGDVYYADLVGTSSRIMAIQLGAAPIVTHAAGALAEVGPFLDHGHSVDVASTTRLGLIGGLSFDADGALYATDLLLHAVYRIDLASDVITRVVGGAACGCATSCANCGDGGPASEADLLDPSDIAFEADGSVLIYDAGNRRLRRVRASDGVIESVLGAGDGPPTCDVIDALPADVRLSDAAGLQRFGGLAVHGTTVFISIPEAAPSGLGCVLRWDTTLGSVSTFAGSMSPADVPGDGGLATDARLVSPHGVAVDTSGNVYFTDHTTLLTDARVRRVTADTPSYIDTLAGGPPTRAVGDGPFVHASLGAPRAALMLGSDEDTALLVLDGASGMVRRVDWSGEDVDTVVGHADHLASNDGALEPLAPFSRTLGDPRGISWDGGSYLYVTEAALHAIRRITLVDANDPKTWLVEDFAGEVGVPGPAEWSTTLGAARFREPSGIAFHAAQEALYVADTGNHVVRRILLATGLVDTVVGVPGAAGSRLGAEGAPRTGADSAVLYAPSGLAVGPAGELVREDDAALYIADTGNHRVLRWSFATDYVERVLGDGVAASVGVGAPARVASVDTPRALAVDCRGDLYIAARDTVRRVQSGYDYVASGDDPVSTIYGDAEPASFPASATRCLSALLLDSRRAAHDRVLVLDECVGYLVALEAERGVCP